MAVAGDNAEKRNYKSYNFRRPDKFSKDHLRALQSIHENFARQFGLLMTTYLRMNVEIGVVSVDQLTYDEFVHSMPSPMTVAIMQLNPLPGQILMGFGHEVTSSVIDRMLGGPGLSESKARELTDIENLLIRRVIDRGTTVLTESWGSIMEVDAKVIGMEDSYSLIQVATPGEIVALITFEVKLGKTESGLLSFCLPYPVLETIIDQLSAQHIFHRQTADAPPDEREKVLSKLGLAKIPLQVYLGGADIKIADLLDLQCGDVIKLNRQAHDDLMVCVNQQPKFWARPGTLKNNLAVYINDVVQDSAQLEYFGLKEH
jgi:flagellar motor switch protein FliM